jgi:hypothetical protein
VGIQVYPELTQFLPRYLSRSERKNDGVEPQTKIASIEQFSHIYHGKGENPMNARQLFSKILSVIVLAALAISIFTPVTQANAQGVCDPATTVGCWQVDEAKRTITWIGPVDGSADVWQGTDYVLTLVRNGFKAIIPNLQVPGELEICVGTVKDGSGKQTKSNCDSVNFTVSKGTLIITESVGQSGGFRWKPAAGYGYNASQYVPSGSSDQQYPANNTPSLPSWSFWFSLLSFLSILLCGGVVSLGILISATISAWRHSAAFGLLVLFVGGALMFFLPVIGHIIVIIIWIAAATQKSAE